MSRIAIFGASGFVGATLVERLRAAGEHEVVPLIGSFGNAWRLSRFSGIELRQVDILDARATREAVDGCTHVVNCSRGSDAAMIKGLKNMLAAARAAGAERFVHLSSVAVYGDPPPPAATDEAAPAEPARGSYGAIKLRQDEIVRAAAESGLPSVTLCPPMISGANSLYLLQVLGAMRKGIFPLVVDGSLPCNLVDVENLCHAIERGLFCDAGKADGRRLFIVDPDETTWRDLLRELAPLVGHDAPAPLFGLEDAKRRFGAPAEPPRGSLVRTMKHLVSGDVRQALRLDPYLEKVDDVLRSAVNPFGKRFEGLMRKWINGPAQVAKVGDDTPVDVASGRIQLRGVAHSCARARATIGYEPPYTFAASMEIFRRWYGETHGFGSESWDLASLLFA